MLEVWPACLVSGLSFGVLQYAVSNFHGPWLVDIVAAVGSMGSLVLFLRMWSPRTVQSDPVRATEPAVSPAAESGAWRAWIPWVFLTVFVFLWGLPAVKASLNGVMSPSVEVPWLHKAVLRMPPVVPKPEAEAAVFNLNLLSATGTALLFAGVLAGLALGMRPDVVLRTYGQTLWNLRVSLLTIALMLALGFTTATAAPIRPWDWRWRGLDSCSRFFHR